MDKEATSPSDKVQYIHDNVNLHVVGPHREEKIFFSGQLTVKETHIGVIVEWQPHEEKEPSPDAENLDWEELSPTCTIGYKNSRTSSIGAVEFKSTTKRPSSESFELAELKSYKCVESPKGKYSELTFYLKDGTTLPTFYFAINEHKCLIQVLEKYVKFIKSCKDTNLYVVRGNGEIALIQKSFGNMELFPSQPRHFVAKFFQDPYGATLGGFSKVSNILFDYVLANNEPAPEHAEDFAELLRESLPAYDINQEEPGFEMITCVELPPRVSVKRSDPLTSQEWLAHIDSEGRIQNIEKLKQKIFKGGITPSLRSEVWKFLLGYYSFTSTSKERETQQKQKIEDYFRMKLQWKSISADQESRFSSLRDKKSLIEKDVNRTDRNHQYFEGENNPHIQMLNDILMTYCMYNFDLGYVQGMSDLLSPILVVIQNEVDAFWCFVKLLERMGMNFEMDQQGMRTQLQNLYTLIQFTDRPLCDYLEGHESGNLYFCFRWLLILFKRDFKFQDIMHLWEVLWTDLPCKNFHLLICLAILDSRKNTIMENNFGLAEILKHINDMAYNIKLEETLCVAEEVYIQLKQCDYLPESVLAILGMQGNSDLSDLESKESQSCNGFPSKSLVKSSVEESSTATEKLSTPRSGRSNPPSPPSASSSVDIIEDYVDLEHHYPVYDLFT